MLKRAYLVENKSETVKKEEMGALNNNASVFLTVLRYKRSFADFDNVNHSVENQ